MAKEGSSILLRWRAERAIVIPATTSLHAAAKARSFNAAFQKRYMSSLPLRRWRFYIWRDAASCFMPRQRQRPLLPRSGRGAQSGVVGGWRVPSPARRASAAARE